MDDVWRTCVLRGRRGAPDARLAFGRTLGSGFAWQAWGFVVMLLRVRWAWQAWGFVHFDVAERAFRGSFACQVWGIAHAACVSRGRRGDWCDLVRRRASFCVAGAGDRGVSLKPVEFVALCEKSAACVCVWMSAALRNRGRRRESVDLLM